VGVLQEMGNVVEPTCSFVVKEIVLTATVKIGHLYMPSNWDYLKDRQLQSHIGTDLIL
jgi:hypothetical protein